MKINALTGESWDAHRKRPGWVQRKLRLHDHLPIELMRANLYELAPGGRTYPYHFHHGEEELLVVLTGEPTLRTTDGERKLSPGDCIVFPRGETGAHALRNDGDEASRILIVSDYAEVSVASYPDSGKTGVWAGELELMVQTDAPEAHLDYWHDEQG